MEVTDEELVEVVKGVLDKKSLHKFNEKQMEAWSRGGKQPRYNYPSQVQLATMLARKTIREVSEELGIGYDALHWHVVHFKIPFNKQPHSFSLNSTFVRSPLRRKPMNDQKSVYPQPKYFSKYSEKVRTEVIKLYLAGWKRKDITKKYGFVNDQVVTRIMIESGAMLHERSPLYKSIASKIVIIKDCKKRMLASRESWQMLKEMTHYPLLDFIIESFDEAIINAQQDIESKEKQLMMIRYGQKVKLEEIDTETYPLTYPKESQSEEVLSVLADLFKESD